MYNEGRVQRASLGGRSKNFHVSIKAIANSPMHTALSIRRYKIAPITIFQCRLNAATTETMPPLRGMVCMFSHPPPSPRFSPHRDPVTAAPDCRTGARTCRGP